MKVMSALKAKRYVADLGQYKFDSCLELLIALFTHYSKGAADWEALTLLLEKTSFNSFMTLNDQQMAQVSQVALRLYNNWSYEMDAERLSYALAASISSGRILMLVDGVQVSDIKQPILVHDQSNLVFLDSESLHQISFSAL